MNVTLEWADNELTATTGGRVLATIATELTDPDALQPGGEAHTALKAAGVTLIDCLSESSGDEVGGWYSGEWTAAEATIELMDDDGIVFAVVAETEAVGWGANLRWLTLERRDTGERAVVLADLVATDGFPRWETQSDWECAPIDATDAFAAGPVTLRELTEREA